MKRLIIKTLSSFGYVLLRADTWQDVQRRLREAEAAKSKSAPAAPPPTPPPPPAPTTDPALDSQLAECRDQLAACAKERHLLSLKMGRAEASIDALARERDRLQAELAASQERFGRADTTGRIQELESKNKHLRQRLADLEFYLKETRGAGTTYL